MALTITPEMLLLINLLINNILNRLLVELEGKSKSEILEMIAAAQAESNELMARLHSTDKTVVEEE